MNNRTITDLYIDDLHQGEWVSSQKGEIRQINEHVFEQVREDEVCHWNIKYVIKIRYEK